MFNSVCNMDNTLNKKVMSILSHFSKVLLNIIFYFYRTDYMDQFEKRDLKAFSAEPLLVYPTHYTGDPGYISDTETSTVWDNDKVRTDWDRARSGKTGEQAKISSEAQNSDVLQSALDTTARDEL